MPRSGWFVRVCIFASLDTSSSLYLGILCIDCSIHLALGWIDRGSTISGWTVVLDAGHCARHPLFGIVMYPSDDDVV
jgi:hypothetical protein